MPITPFQVRKDHLATTRWHEQSDAPLAGGQVRVRIDRFALTSGSRTCTAFGDAKKRHTAWGAGGLSPRLVAARGAPRVGYLLQMQG